MIACLEDLRTLNTNAAKDLRSALSMYSAIERSGTPYVFLARSYISHLLELNQRRSSLSEELLSIFYGDDQETVEFLKQEIDGVLVIFNVQIAHITSLYEAFLKDREEVYG